MLKVCAVYDQAIEAYGTPVFVVANGAAMRSFVDEVNRSDSQLNSHPSDYSLYFLGEYDERSGLIIPCDPPKLLIKGSDSISV